MKTKNVMYCATVLLLAACGQTEKTEDMKPPVAEIIPHELKKHGDRAC
jgi:uncharacterized lipoprotein YajG